MPQKFFRGIGAPPPDLGAFRDYYVDVENGLFYGPKIWPRSWGPPRQMTSVFRALSEDDGVVLSTNSGVVLGQDKIVGR